MKRFHNDTWKGQEQFSFLVSKRFGLMTSEANRRAVTHSLHPCSIWTLICAKMLHITVSSLLKQRSVGVDDLVCSSITSPGSCSAEDRGHPASWLAVCSAPRQHWLTGPLRGFAIITLSTCPSLILIYKTLIFLTPPVIPIRAASSPRLLLRPYRRPDPGSTGFFPFNLIKPN